MYPNRRPFARTRGALGVATALAIAAFACDMPSPEVVAPDGTNQASKKIYGGVIERIENKADAPEAVVARYFPSIKRGEEGPAVLFVVRSDKGKVVLTDVQVWGPGEPTRGEANQAKQVVEEVTAPRGAVTLHEKVLQAGKPTEVRLAQGERLGEPTRDTFLKLRPTPWKIPTGIGGLQPNDIATVEVSKHAAGTVAPKAVSIVTIVLKPNAQLPTREER